MGPLETGWAQYCTMRDN